jgi:hypothetical protein
MIASAEIFTRIVGGKPATFSYSGSFRDRQTDWDVVYGVTSAGLRVTCEGAKNADAKRRIAIIGDSFVFGQGVSDCNTFASRLGVVDKKSLFGTLADTSSAFALLRKVKRAFAIKAFLKETGTAKSDKAGSGPVLNNISSIIANDPNYFAKVADPGEAELAIFRRAPRKISLAKP